MTAQELLKIARNEKPNIKYVTNDKQDTVAAWDEKQGRYVIVAGLLLTGQWAHLPIEILINGEPVKRNWIDI